LKVLPGFATSLGVTQQDPRLVPRPTDEADCEVLDYVATGWIDVRGTFEEFWQARGRNLRQNLRKTRRRLEEHGEIIAFEFLEQADAVDAALLEFAALESAGWKADGGTAISAENPQGLFYRETLHDYAARGSGFAIRLTMGGRPIAVDFGVRDAESLVILKTTYDEKLKAFSPAQLLHEQAFEHIFQRSLSKRIEFYGKLMEWHTRWTEQSRVLFHVNVYRSSLMRRARDSAKWARRRIRQARSQFAGG
jgi:CelD/BcsL family acetyltransferase involved in cellulose biosynthesis